MLLHDLSLLIRLPHFWLIFAIPLTVFTIASLKEITNKNKVYALELISLIVLDQFLTELKTDQDGLKYLQSSILSLLYISLTGLFRVRLFTVLQACSLVYLTGVAGDILLCLGLQKTQGILVWSGVGGAFLKDALFVHTLCAGLLIYLFNKNTYRENKMNQACLTQVHS